MVGKSIAKGGKIFAVVVKGIAMGGGFVVVWGVNSIS